MIPKLYSFIILASFFTIVSCSDEPISPNTGPNNNPDFVVPTITPTGNENYLNHNSDYIFDQDKLHTFHLKIPNDALASINDDPSAEEYVEGTLIFEGDTISPVGIRYKGSVGAWVNCLSGNNLFDPSGHKTCSKLSMKIKINWEEREEKFFKLKKLQLHSMNLDPSQMHERLGYWLFREMGVPSPRTVHAKLMINDEYEGLFALTEQIDNRFVKYNFDDDEGNLYKEIWPLAMNGAPHADQKYKNALKTNEDENPSVDLIKNFGQSIADAELPEARNKVEQFMNIDEVMSYVVVDRMIRHDDGPFHWYCNGNDCSSHNFFWYEEPTNQKLHLIPWDLDNAFDNIINDANPITPIADDWGQSSNNCSPFQYLSARQWSAHCDELTATWASYSDEFDLIKQQLIDGPMSASSVNEKLDAWHNQIMEATKEASEKHIDAISIAQWESAITELKEQLEFARSK